MGLAAIGGAIGAGAELFITHGASVVEVFGMPGDRYTYHPRYEDMRFLFTSKKDYQLCKILLSDKI